MKLAPLLMVACIAAGAAYGSGSADEESFTALGIRSVTVKAQFLDVEVESADTPRVTLNLDAPEDSFFSPRGYRVRSERTGSRLNVWVEKDWASAGGRGVLTLRTPRSMELRVESVSGRITVRGLGGGSCFLKSVSGMIRLQDVRASVSSETVSGDISFQSVKGGFRLKTISGAIVGKNVTIAADSSFSSVSGTIDIRSETGNDSLRFDLSSISGRIEVGGIRAAKGLKMGFTGPLVRAQTVSGLLLFR